MSPTPDVLQSSRISNQLILRYGIKESTGVLLTGVLLFSFAGTLQWWPAWVMVAILGGWSLITTVVILRTDPALIADRLAPRKTSKKWDVLILSVIGVMNVAKFAVAGLDYRYGWVGEFSTTIQGLGLLLTVIGYALVIWATASNAFFSQIVRIQTERNHKVETGGPYAWIRHPGYLGAILFELAIPLFLNSPWALNIGIFNALLFVVRAALEDRTLHTELDGYEEYAKGVRYRLFPLIW